MKSYNSELVEDVEELLEKVVLEEVTTAVWKTFEQALSQLDPQSRELLENHLNGTTTEQLSQETHLPEKEIKNWIKQVKRQLQQNIRKDLRVRQ